MTGCQVRYQSGRLGLSECPECRSAIAPGHAGEIRRGGRRRRWREVASWCIHCGAYWVHRRSFGPRASDPLEVSTPRRASPVEARIARRKLFTDRGIAEPVDG